MPATGHGYAYQKLKRKIGDYATAAAAVVLTLKGGGECRELFHRPYQRGGDATVGERSRRRSWSARGSMRLPVKRAVAAAEAITSPASDTARPARYRTKMAGVMLARALARAKERAPGPDGEDTSMAKSQISMRVNGATVDALVEPRILLIHFLREQLNLTGPHIGCDTSHCGACTVDHRRQSR